MLPEFRVTSTRFANRSEAGRALAALLAHYRGQPGLVVLALPRGGVPVGFEVAEALGAALDVFLVRKLGMPGHPEFAMGAIASGGVRVMSDDVVRLYGVDAHVIERVARAEQAELDRREREYRQNHPAVDLQGKTVILITHKLREILAITDHVSVMRRGELVATRGTKGTTVEELAELMVGRRVLLRVKKGKAKPGAGVLSVEHLTYRDSQGVKRVDDVSFTVRA